LIQTQPKYINYEQPHPPYENRGGCSGTWHYTPNVPALHCHQRRHIAQAILLSLRQFFNRRISVSVHWPASANFLRSDGVIKSAYAELYAPNAPIMHSRGMSAKRSRIRDASAFAAGPLSFPRISNMMTPFTRLLSRILPTS